jgi:hypothetical protein
MGDGRGRNSLRLPLCVSLSHFLKEPFAEMTCVMLPQMARREMAMGLPLIKIRGKSWIVFLKYCFAEIVDTYNRKIQEALFFIYVIYNTP